ncbi:hypothetical protein JET64_01355 [Pseudomonas putida]|nr:hypothetical protein [Pseudomonas putida]
MGTVIKSSRDGFRRAGLAHYIAGTFYQDGELSERQLDMLRNDPKLLVVEGVQEDALQVAEDNTELMQEMRSAMAKLSAESGEAIAALEYDLEQARAGLGAASADLVRVLEQQKAVPALVVEGAKALPPADPTQEGVICISADILATLIADRLLPPQDKPEEQHDGNSTLATAGDSQPPQSPAPVPPVAPTPGAEPEAVSTDKVPGKRAGSGKAAKNGAD